MNLDAMFRFLVLAFACVCTGELLCKIMNHIVRRRRKPLTETDEEFYAGVAAITPEQNAESWQGILDRVHAPNKHEPQVTTMKKMYAEFLRGACSCGWVSQGICDTTTQAMKDAQQHADAKNRKNS